LIGPKRKSAAAEGYSLESESSKPDHFLSEAEFLDKSCESEEKEKKTKKEKKIKESGEKKEKKKKDKDKDKDKEKKEKGKDKGKKQKKKHNKSGFNVIKLFLRRCLWTTIS